MGVVVEGKEEAMSDVLYVLVGFVVGWAVAEIFVIPSRWYRRWRNR